MPRRKVNKYILCENCNTYVPQRDDYGQENDHCPRCGYLIIGGKIMNLYETVGSLNYELYLDGICCQDFYTFVEANLENCHGNTFEEIITELRNEYPNDMPCKDRFDEYLELLEDKLYESIERRTD